MLHTYWWHSYSKRYIPLLLRLPLDAASSISHIKMIVPAAVLKQLRTSPDSVEETDEETKRLELYTVRLLLACCYCSGASTVCTI